MPSSTTASDMFAAMPHRRRQMVFGDVKVRLGFHETGQPLTVSVYLRASATDEDSFEVRQGICSAYFDDSEFPVCVRVYTADTASPQALRDLAHFIGEPMAKELLGYARRIIDGPAEDRRQALWLEFVNATDYLELFFSLYQMYAAETGKTFDRHAILEEMQQFLTSPDMIGGARDWITWYTDSSGHNLECEEDESNGDLQEEANAFNQQMSTLTVAVEQALAEMKI